MTDLKIGDGITIEGEVYVIKSTSFTKKCMLLLIDMHNNSKLATSENDYTRLESVPPWIESWRTDNELIIRWANRARSISAEKRKSKNVNSSD